MRNRKILRIALIIIGVVEPCFILYIGINPIEDYLCRQDTPIAALDAGTNHVISISGKSCWEVGRALYYRVFDNGKLISSKSFFDSDDGNNHSYSLVFADDKSLVGVLDATSKPSQIVIIYDFQTGEKLTIFSSNDTWGDKIQKLQQENPRVDLAF